MDLQQLCDKLREIIRSKNYLTIEEKFDRSFDRITTEILPQCLERQLTSEEKTSIDLVSSLELIFIEYFMNIYNEDKPVTPKVLRQRLFENNKINVLVDLVEKVSNENLDDDIFLYLSRMIDARTLFCRFCFKELGSKPNTLYTELASCLKHQKMKDALDQTIFPEEIHSKLSINTQRFFLGCTTFAVALYEQDRPQFGQDDAKFVYRLAKFIRIILSKENFAENDWNVYCLRGIFALLTNTLQINYWLSIINEALASETGSKARQQNPFNYEFFSLLISKLFGSPKLRRDVRESATSHGALLVDIAMIFLEKWCFTAMHDVSGSTETPNQVIDFLRSFSIGGQGHADKSELFVYYLEAKNRRTRLMSFAILVNMLNLDDLKTLQKTREHLVDDLVALIFKFIEKAAAENASREYRGISLDSLFLYLYRFLIQDFIKIATLKYLPLLVQYAVKRETMVIKILQRISANPELRSSLNQCVELGTFLDKKADVIYVEGSNERKMIETIRQNLRPDPPTNETRIRSVEPNFRQAFISYCQKESDLREKFVDQLKQLNVFTRIWIDKEQMEGDMFMKITASIRESEVVFVLVSQLYCDSDMCRRELYFAKTIGKKVIAIVLHRSFKISAIDWLLFLSGSDQYYRLDEKDQMSKLFDLLKSKPKTESKPNEVKKKSEQRYLQTPVMFWTSTDIHDWCEDNQFNDFIRFLKNYDGQCLLELYRNLLVVTFLPNFSSTNGLDLFEVTRFKCKLEQIIHRSSNGGTIRQRN